MNITRITAPMFKVHEYGTQEEFILNEYELRQLMIDVKKGLQPANIRVTDMLANESIINEQGFIVGELHGLDLISNLTINLLKL